MKYKWFFLIIVLIGGSNAWGAKNSIGQAQSQVLVVHQLMWAGHPNFYGSAILYKIVSNKAYFITAAHVVPRQQTEAGALTIQGPLTENVAVPLTVVSKSPGDDIAVLQISTDNISSSTLSQFSKEILPQAFHDRPFKKEVRLQATFVGIEDALGNSFLYSLSWKEAINVLQGLRNKDQTFLQKKVFSDRRIAPGLTEITPTRDCPAATIMSCYLLKKLSWGFSGGAVYSEIAPRSNWKITGMVTHFSYLTPNTYVTPISIAISIADSLIHDSTSRRDIHDQSGRAIMRILDASNVQVISGPLHGKQVFARNLLMEAGGDNAGGGGDNAGGGADDIGDDAVESPSKSTMDSTLERLWKNAVRATVSQEKPLVSWGMKGLNSLLSFKSGIRVGDSLVGVSSPTGTVALETMRDFINAYQKNPKNVVLINSEEYRVKRNSSFAMLSTLMVNQGQAGIGIEIPSPLTGSVAGTPVVQNARLELPLGLEGDGATLTLNSTSQAVAGRQHVLYMLTEKILFEAIKWEALGPAGLRAHTHFSSELLVDTYVLNSNQRQQIESASVSKRSGITTIFMVPNAEGNGLYLKMLRSFLDGPRLVFDSYAVPISTLGPSKLNSKPRVEPVPRLIDNTK